MASNFCRNSSENRGFNHLCSKIREDSEVIRKLRDGTYNEENFKWPEWPFLAIMCNGGNFMGANNGTIKSPDSDKVDSTVGNANDNKANRCSRKIIDLLKGNISKANENNDIKQKRVSESNSDGNGPAMQQTNVKQEPKLEPENPTNQYIFVLPPTYGHMPQINLPNNANSSNINQIVQQLTGGAPYGMPNLLGMPNMFTSQMHNPDPQLMNVRIPNIPLEPIPAEIMPKDPRSISRDPRILKRQPMELIVPIYDESPESVDFKNTPNKFNEAMIQQLNQEILTNNDCNAVQAEYVYFNEEKMRSVAEKTNSNKTIDSKLNRMNPEKPHVDTYRQFREWKEREFTMNAATSLSPISSTNLSRNSSNNSLSQISINENSGELSDPGNGQNCSSTTKIDGFTSQETEEVSEPEMKPNVEINKRKKRKSMKLHKKYRIIKKKIPPTIINKKRWQVVKGLKIPNKIESLDMSDSVDTESEEQKIPAATDLQENDTFDSNEMNNFDINLEKSISNVYLPNFSIENCAQENENLNSMANNLNLGSTSPISEIQDLENSSEQSQNNKIDDISEDLLNVEYQDNVLLTTTTNPNMEYFENKDETNPASDFSEDLKLELNSNEAEQNIENINGDEVDMDSDSTEILDEILDQKPVFAVDKSTSLTNQNLTDHPGESVLDPLINSVDDLNAFADLVDDGAEKFLLACESDKNVNDTDSELEQKNVSITNRNNCLIPVNTDANITAMHNPFNKKCVLCSFESKYNWKSLVQHYVNKHPKSEVFISRLPNKYKSEVINNIKSTQVFIVNGLICALCYFCDKKFKLTQSNWITHFSRHTGELEYKCTTCKAMLGINTHLKCGNTANEKINDYKFDNEMLNAYECKVCNFTQLTEEHVINHLKNEHQINESLSLFYEKICLLNIENLTEIELLDKKIDDEHILIQTDEQFDDDDNAFVGQIENEVITQSIEEIVNKENGMEKTNVEIDKNEVESSNVCVVKTEKGTTGNGTEPTIVSNTNRVPKVSQSPMDNKNSAEIQHAKRICPPVYRLVGSPITVLDSDDETETKFDSKNESKNDSKIENIVDVVDLLSDDESL